METKDEGMRRGFTLVELLVVIVIIGILVALLLPAVQSAREAGRRSACMNNVKQIMLAMHMHNDAKKGFPPCRTLTPGQFRGWMVDLLPFMEQSSRYDNYKFDKNFYAPENQPIVSLPLDVAICPSSPGDARKFEMGLFSKRFGTQGVAGDYFVNHLLNSTSAKAAGLTCNPCRPVLFVQGGEENQLHPLSKVTDGTSNVIFITEQAGRNDYYIRGKRQATNSGLIVANWWGPWASFQHYQYQGYTADGTALGTACSVNCNNGQGPYAFHPGGVIASRVDGSVALISEQISLSIMTELLTRDGGEVNSE